MNEDQSTPAAHPESEGTGNGSSAKINQVLSGFEKSRSFSGISGLALTVVAIAASVYHLFYAYAHPYFALDHRALHWFFMSIIIFARYPFSKSISPKSRLSVFDWLFMAASCGISL